jgi:hypothetical protein
MICATISALSTAITLAANTTACYVIAECAFVGLVPESPTQLEEDAAAVTVLGGSSLDLSDCLFASCWQLYAGMWGQQGCACHFGTENLSVARVCATDCRGIDGSFAHMREDCVSAALNASTFLACNTEESYGEGTVHVRSLSMSASLTLVNWSYCASRANGAFWFSQELACMRMLLCVAAGEVGPTAVWFMAWRAVNTPEIEMCGFCGDDNNHGSVSAQCQEARLTRCIFTACPRPLGSYNPVFLLSACVFDAASAAGMTLIISTSGYIVDLTATYHVAEPGPCGSGFVPETAVQSRTPGQPAPTSTRSPSTANLTQYSHATSPTATSPFSASHTFRPSYTFTPSRSGTMQSDSAGRGESLGGIIGACSGTTVGIALLVTLAVMCIMKRRRGGLHAGAGHSLVSIEDEATADGYHLVNNMPP